MSLEQEFDQAAKEVMDLPQKPSNEDLLALYAFFKQGKEGDVQGKRPGLLDVKGRKKYDSWAEIKGMGQEEAMQKYVALVKKFKAAS